ncbi:hypothetical protein PR048_024843 [Dryococelus australis]|uniref:Uncharacterized protein n=1 Tax=Dryococelus australis TaxID=614101 RepID=A0ABQ9GPR2_9NEOP|nr:hypothetical protein PR048_024843 [Dryococelus australis]
MSRCYRYFLTRKKVPQVANARLLTWSMILFSYQYKIKYKKGFFLSRLPNNCLVALPDDYDCKFIYMSTPLVSHKEVACLT